LCTPPGLRSPRPPRVTHVAHPVQPGSLNVNNRKKMANSTDITIRLALRDNPAIKKSKLNQSTKILDLDEISNLARKIKCSVL
jgi:hypothetical protein